MADYNSSLPVRTETAGDVIIKIADSVTPSQQAQVTAARELSVLATAQPGVDIGDVTVNNGSGGAAVNIQDGGNSITVDAVNLDIRDLSSATDSVTVIQGTSPWVTSNNNLPATVDTDYGTVGASTIRTAAQIGNATGAADFDAGATGAQTLRVEANQGAANATPWNVAFASPGDSINDLKSASAIAAGASDNHDYTVTALKTLFLNQVEAAGSGKAKMVVQIETGVATGVFTSRFVQFNSTAETNMEIHLDNPIQVAAGVRVRVVMSNRDLLAQDLYSTISGYEI